MSEPQCRVHEWHRANRSTYVRTNGRTDKQVQMLSESVLAGYLDELKRNGNKIKTTVCMLASSLIDWLTAVLFLFGVWHERERVCVRVAFAFKSFVVVLEY